MARCIYVPERELNDDRPPNERTKSIEHVVSWALGGSNGCTVDDVSTKANNDLGTEIDASFSNLLPIASWRHTLKLEGQSGTIPPIVFDAVAAKNGTPAEIRFHADGQVEFRAKLCAKRKSLSKGRINYYRQLKLVDQFPDPIKDLGESRLIPVIKSAAILIRFFVELAHRRTAEDEGLVLRDVLVVGFRKAFGLMGLVRFRADECLYIGSA
jgi:hypothetical protein